MRYLYIYIYITILVFLENLEPMLSKILFGLVAFAAAAELKTSTDSVCDSLREENPKLFGLCYAYCEAVDCDGSNIADNRVACDRIKYKFQAASVAQTTLPCEQPIAYCPCESWWNGQINILVDDGKSFGTNSSDGRCTDTSDADQVTVTDAPTSYVYILGAILGEDSADHGSCNLERRDFTGLEIPIDDYVVTLSNVSITELQLGDCRQVALDLNCGGATN